MKLPLTTAHTLNDSDIKVLTEFAGALADLAGQSIVPHFRQSIVVDEKPGRGYFDPVTVADRAAETVMRDHIHRNYPDHGIFGEEHGYEAGNTGLTWVLDPIDGTRAFITGMPLWGTLIALYDGCRPVIGIVDQPVLKERFIGNRMQALYVTPDQQKAIHTRRCQHLSDAVLMATAPEIFTCDAEKNAFAAVSQATRMTRYGGDCYAYCMLACGFVDVIVESGLAPYDIQALIPVIEQAGGLVTDWQGGSAVNGGQVVAAGSGAIHQQVIDILQSAATDST